MHRRELIQALGILAALGAAGCSSDDSSGQVFPRGDNGGGGNGGGGSTPLPANTRLLSGTVDPALGSNLMTQSAFSRNSPVSGGQFQTVVNSNVTQAIFLTDAAGLPRALALTQLSSQSVRFDAESTALSLVFLTVGILTIDPVETTDRLSKIKGFTNFPAFQNYLADNYLVKDLRALFQLAEYQSLLAAVVADWQNAQIRKATTASGLLDFTITPETKGTLKPKIAVSNEGWRYVGLLERNLDEGHHVVNGVGFKIPKVVETANFIPGVINLVSGANPASWGNLFTSQIGSAGSGNIQVDLTGESATRHIEFTVVGLGAVASVAKLPTGANNFDASYASSSISTVLAYVVGPALDIFGMSGNFLHNTEKLVLEFAGNANAAVTNVANVSGATISNSQGSNNSSVNSAIADLAVAIFTYMLAFLKTKIEANVLLFEGDTVLSAIGLSAIPALELIVGLQAGVSTLNTLIVAGYLTKVPFIGVQEVEIGGASRFSASTVRDTPDFQGGAVNKVGHVAYYTSVTTTAQESVTVTEIHLLAGSDRIIATSTLTAGVGNALREPILNDLDEVAYVSQFLFNNAPEVGLLWRNGATVNLGTLGLQTIPLAINNLTQVAGQSVVGNDYHAFLWQSGHIADANSRPTVGFSVALNDASQLAVREVVNSEAAVVLYSGTARNVLSAKSVGENIFLNSAGQVGFSVVDDQGAERAAIATVEGGIKILDVLPSTFESRLVGLDDSGRAVGYCDTGTTAQPVRVWTLWESDGRPVVLQSLVPGSTGQIAEVIATGRGGHILIVEIKDQDLNTRLTLLTPA